MFSGVPDDKLQAYTEETREHLVSQSLSLAQFKKQENIVKAIYYANTCFGSLPIFIKEEGKNLLYPFKEDFNLKDIIGIHHVSSGLRDKYGIKDMDFVTTTKGPWFLHENLPEKYVILANKEKEAISKYIDLNAVENALKNGFFNDEKKDITDLIDDNYELAINQKFEYNDLQKKSFDNFMKNVYEKDMDEQSMHSILKKIVKNPYLFYVFINGNHKDFLNKINNDSTIAIYLKKKLELDFDNKGPK